MTGAPDMCSENSRAEVIKHLEMIQAIITRLARNSFLIKSWSLTLITAVAVLLYRHPPLSNDKGYLIILLTIPVLFFWWLDAYFLRQERLFRGLYDHVRQKDKTDFSMNIGVLEPNKKNTYWRVIFSITLFPWYGIELAFLAAVFFLVPFNQ